MYSIMKTEIKLKLACFGTIYACMSPVFIGRPMYWLTCNVYLYTTNIQNIRCGFLSCRVSIKSPLPFPVHGTFYYSHQRRCTDSPINTFSIVLAHVWGAYTFNYCLWSTIRIDNTWYHCDRVGTPQPVSLPSRCQMRWHSLQSVSAPVTPHRFPTSNDRHYSLPSSGSGGFRSGQRLVTLI